MSGITEYTSCVYYTDTFNDLVLSNTQMTLSSGLSANNTTLSGNGILYVSDGGAANGITINAWSCLEVEKGGKVSNISIGNGGGNDTFCFGKNWGNDTVEQLAGGKVTLWFADGSESNWNSSSLTYSDGTNSVTVSGVTEVTLKFGGDAPVAGAFLDAASEKIFEDKNSGMLA